LYQHKNPDASEQQLVKMGRVVSLAALIIAMVAAKPLLGSFDQAFQYIQEFTGFFTPGIVVLFLLGVFWRKMNASGAIAAAIGSAVCSFGFKMLWPELPFMDRVGLVFLLCVLLAVVFSLLSAKADEGDKAVDLSDINFATSKGYNIATVAVIAILVAFYSAWW